MELNEYRKVYEDTGTADPMREEGPKTPEPGRTPGEILTLAGTLGGGWGAHMAVKAGGIVCSAWVPVGAAALGGIAASGYAGWELGKLIGGIDAVERHVQDLVDQMFGEPGGPAPSAPHLRPPTLEAEKWQFKDGEQASDVYFYVADPSDSQAAFAEDFYDGGIDVYSDPFEAMDYAQEIGLIGQHNDMSGLYILYTDFVTDPA